MNRLQKKCVIATAGFHLLLLVILFVGPAFFKSEPKVDNSKVLDMISPNLVDAALDSGVKNAQSPPPTPIVTLPQPQQQQPTPPQPKIVQPAPAPVPQPTLLNKLEKLFKSEPAQPTPTETQPHTPKVDLHVVTRTAPKSSPTTKPKDNSLAARKLTAELRSKLSSATQVDMPGDSSASSTSYANAVKSVYDRAWTLPDSVANDENITVSVTIASDGTVISSSIITPSGDGPADASVQRALDRVKFVAAFPDGATDKERTYTIIFNPQVKSSE
jgi:TonB family protein